MYLYLSYHLTKACGVARLLSPAGAMWGLEALGLVRGSPRFAEPLQLPCSASDSGTKDDRCEPLSCERERQTESQQLRATAGMEEAAVVGSTRGRASLRRAC